MSFGSLNKENFSWLNCTSYSISNNPDTSLCTRISTKPSWQQVSLGAHCKHFRVFNIPVPARNQCTSTTRSNSLKRLIIVVHNSYFPGSLGQVWTLPGEQRLLHQRELGAHPSRVPRFVGALIHPINLFPFHKYPDAASQVHNPGKMINGEKVSTKSSEIIHAMTLDLPLSMTNAPLHHQIYRSAPQKLLCDPAAHQ